MLDEIADIMIGISSSDVSLNWAISSPVAGEYIFQFVMYLMSLRHIPNL